MRYYRSVATDFNAVLATFRMMRKCAPVRELLDLIPGLRSVMAADLPDTTWLKRREAIILAMTPAERTQPELLDGSRKLRIAKGSGTSVSEVSELLLQLSQQRERRT